MFRNSSGFRLTSFWQIAFAVTLAVMIISSTPVFAALTPLLNGSFESDVVGTGSTPLTPINWRQTYGNGPIHIYRPGEGDAFYGQIPDGSQAVLYSAGLSQELQPGDFDMEGTGIIMEEGVTIRMLFDAVYFTETETGGGIQISALNTASYNHQFFTPNSAVDGFGTFTYEYTPVADDVGKDFSFWCYSTTDMSEFLIDNFRYETIAPLVKPPKPGPVAGGPVIAGGTTPYAWYRSDVGVTPYDSEPTTVAWWQDQSGNSRHIESFGDPQITNNGPEGAQTITLDGDGDHFIGDADSAEWGEAAPGTVFAVWQRSSDAEGSNCYVYDAHLDEQRQLFNIDLDNEKVVAGGGEFTAPSTWINHTTSVPDTPETDVADPGADEWFVTSVSSTTGLTDTLRINGVEAYSGDLLSGGMSGLRIGSFVTDKYFWDGDIVELIVFEGDLSATEREAIEADLMARWGVSTPEEPIPGDANGDKKVDGSDVTILAGNWQKGVSDGLVASWGEGDFNGDGKVDGSDVTILAGNWQSGVTVAAASVPEPSTLVALLLIALTTACFTKKR